MTTHIVSIADLSYAYPAKPECVLDNVGLDVKQGEAVLLVGKSGCGKSTLARCLNGLIPHFYKGSLTGTLSVCGINPASTSVWQMANRVGMVFQNPESQLFTLAVEDEVAFGPENFALPREDIRSRVNWALGAVGLRGLRERPVFELSDGQKQRLAVAANLSCLPDILVLDEPTSNLDSEARRLFIDSLIELKRRRNRTIVLIDHRLHGLEDLIDTVAVVDNGCITKTGSDTFFSDVDAVREYGLRSYGLGEERSTTQGKPVYVAPVQEGNAGSEKMDDVIVVRNASFGYENGFSLSNISLAIRKGEIVAIVGGNGSGKTTLLKLIAGLLKPVSGTVLADGKDTRHTSVAQLAHAVTLVLQNPDHQLFMSTVYEEVFFRGGNGCAGNSHSGERAENLLRDMNLWRLRDRHPHSLSYGEKQRVTIASALAREPEVVLLDEPTSGMDGSHLDALKTELRRLNRAGLTIVVATHDEEFIDGLCGRLISLDNGGIGDVAN